MPAMTVSPTMKSRFRLAGIALFFLVSMLVAFGFGAANRYRHHILLSGSELAATQAIVRFNHLQTFRDLESDLSAGCADVALEKTRIAVDDELSWLSWFRSEHAISPIYEYIEKRDAMLLGQLENFVSRYPESAQVPVCGNRTAVSAVQPAQ